MLLKTRNFWTGFVATFTTYLKTVEQNVFRNANAVLSCNEHKIKRSIRKQGHSLWEKEVLKCPKASFIPNFKIKSKRKLPLYH